MQDTPIYNVGLGGDGDEVAAIEDVEREFGVVLPNSDAAHWMTAGDVFASLLNALPANAAEDPQVWNRFTKALAGQSGIEPALVSKASPLLLPQSAFWAGFDTAWAYLVWGVIAAGLFAIGSEFFANC